MKHLLRLEDLSVVEIEQLLDRAQRFIDGAPAPQFPTKIACNLFFEPSTRTQYSFNVAEEKLGMRVISFNPATSSLNKQESFYDTVKTFDSFGVGALIIRHPENEYYKQLLGHVDAAILNGGDGTGNHPTQSLLDLLTIKQEYGHFDGLECAIIGDVRHSRVAHTNIEVMNRLGMQVVTSGPEEYMEESCAFEDFKTAVSSSDIVMLLRVQHERHNASSVGARAEHVESSPKSVAQSNSSSETCKRPDEKGFTEEGYHKKYGLNDDTVKWMKPGAIIMHPAPVNRNVEIADSIMECERSRIFKQMANGVFIRMAALERSMS